MKLSKLQLVNFKNYKSFEQGFSEAITCFVGENGEGKTNLLDSIFYLCIGKSYFHSVEKFNRTHEMPFLRITGDFLVENKEIQIVVISQASTPKKIQKNKVNYEKVSEHLGFSPVCFIAPDDSIILQGGSEYRRKFLDTTLSQMNKNYLLQLIEYKKILQQRNALLKEEQKNIALLRTYNYQLAPLGQSIFGVRDAYVAELSKKATAIYKTISQEKEEITCTYNSKLFQNDFKQLLEQSEAKDFMLKRTTVGIHKDDLSLLINGHELKKVGSQGQQKTAILALKLAEYELLSAYSKQSPILLLDDIFDKLDEKRVEQLFAYIVKNYDSQLFITDTDGERLNRLLKKFNRNFEIFTVSDNKVKSYA